LHEILPTKIVPNDLALLPTVSPRGHVIQPDRVCGFSAKEELLQRRYEYIGRHHVLLAFQDTVP
jgi:hypothetical protein